MDTCVSKLWKTAQGEAWCAAVHGVHRVRHDLVTEQQYMYNGITLLYTWNEHSIVNQLYPKIIKSFLKVCIKRGKKKKKYRTSALPHQVRTHVLTSSLPWLRLLCRQNRRGPYNFPSSRKDWAGMWEIVKECFTWLGKNITKNKTMGAESLQPTRQRGWGQGRTSIRDAISRMEDRRFKIWGVRQCCRREENLGASIDHPWRSLAAGWSRKMEWRLVGQVKSMEILFTLAMFYFRMRKAGCV